MTDIIESPDLQQLGKQAMERREAEVRKMVEAKS